MQTFKNPFFRILGVLFLLALLFTLIFVQQFVHLGEGTLNAAAKAMYLFFAVISGSWAILMLFIFAVVKYLEKRMTLMMSDMKKYRRDEQVIDYQE
ncbi:MAG: hypothetical protein ACK4NC_02795 [Candidatus Gracilibacteria bacterium]